MPKRLRSPTVSRHFIFFEEDLEFAERHWGPKTPRGLSVNEIVRTIFHDAIKRARQRMVEQADAGQLAEPTPPTSPLDF